MTKPSTWPTIRPLFILLFAAGLFQPASADDSTGPADGKKIYDSACARCHSSGFAAFFTGAPKLGSPDWKARLAAAGSLDALTASAAKGKRDMPARGGVPSLPDADLKAAVVYILDKSGVE
jgi:cytochrome c5